MVLAAAMLYGTPEQKSVATDQLEKLATAGAQLSGKNAPDLAADLAAKLASTAWKETKGERKTTNAEGPRYMETAVFVSAPVVLKAIQPFLDAGRRVPQLDEARKGWLYVYRCFFGVTLKWRGFQLLWAETRWIFRGRE